MIVMNRLFSVKYISLLLALSVPWHAAHAGLYGDEFSKCLVKHADLKDRVELMRWVFIVISINPNLSDLITVKPEQREPSGRATTKLLERLVLTDCRTEAMEAMKYEGASVMQSSFEVLGRVAMAELISNQATNAEFEKLGTYIDKDAWTELGNEVSGKSRATEKAK
jgi:hypothetical protein